MVPVSDYAQEYLMLEDKISTETDVEKIRDMWDRKLNLLDKIKELRPLQDPSMIIGRYRP
jgi:hypothetical protein